MSSPLDESFPGFLLIDAVTLEVSGNGAPSDAEDGAATRQDVEGGGFLSQAYGLMQRHQVHCGPYAYAAGGLGHGGGNHERCRHDGKAGVEVQLGQPSRVETQFVRQLHLRDGVLVSLSRRLVLGTGHLVENAEIHGWPLNRGCCPDSTPVGPVPLWGR